MFRETEVTRITIRIILTIFGWHSSKTFTFFLSSLSTYNPNLYYVWQFGAVLMWDHDRRVTLSKFTRMVDLNGSGSLGVSWTDAVKGSFLTGPWALRIISSSSFLLRTQTKKVHSQVANQCIPWLWEVSTVSTVCSSPAEVRDSLGTWTF